MGENVDARGLSCPQPVILTRKALQETSTNEVVVLVDTMTQVHNCTRAAEKLGWQVSYQEKTDVFELTFRKPTSAG
jgi:TusA-related sulfurtransferase